MEKYSSIRKKLKAVEKEKLIQEMSLIKIENEKLRWLNIEYQMGLLNNLRGILLSNYSLYIPMYNSY